MFCYTTACSHIPDRIRDHGCRFTRLAHLRREYLGGVSPCLFTVPGPTRPRRTRHSTPQQLLAAPHIPLSVSARHAILLIQYTAIQYTAIQYMASQYIFRRFNTGSLINGTHWLPNKELTKLWEVTVTKLRRTGSAALSVSDRLQCDTSTLNLRPGGRVGSPRGRGRLTSEVKYRLFSRKRHWISWTSRFRPDPTRPDLDLGAQFSYPIPRPTPLRPDLTLESAEAPFWALSYRVLRLGASHGGKTRLFRLKGKGLITKFTLTT